MPPRGELTVLYDGACPVCAREIAFYRDRPGVEVRGLAWADVAQAAPPCLDRAAALARLHALLPDGRLIPGAAAFAEVWQRVPGLRWLGRLVACWPVTPLAELAYRGVPRVRRPWR
jgi:predicted DCC family thiol-disulfide oxidoreductase YuxK